MFPSGHEVQPVRSTGVFECGTNFMSSANAPVRARDSGTAGRGGNGWISRQSSAGGCSDGPGFAADGEDPEHLGEKLALPPFLEPRRASIEASIKPLIYQPSVPSPS